MVPYPQGTAPSQRFRFEQYLDYLKDHGIEVEIHPFLDNKAWKVLYSEGNTLHKVRGILRGFGRRFLLLFKLKGRIVFIHREASMIGPPVFEWIIAKVLRKRIIYDFDDAVWLPNYSEVNARFQKIKWYRKIFKIFKWADTITAGNTYLAEQARNYNKQVQILPTTIDTEGYHNPTLYQKVEHTKLCIGWTGTQTTVKYLEFLVPILNKLKNQFEFEFIVISNQAPDFEIPNGRFIKWKKESEIEDLMRFDIGVMPLVQDQWSEGKCGFKALQYMALEIPTILSPIGVNKTIVQQHLNGILADTPEDWENALISLLENTEKRNQLGAEGRKRVIEAYSVLAQQNNYLALFQEK